MKNKYSLLAISIILDLIGLVSFSIPTIGEFSDVIWAPLSAYLMLKLYKGMPAKVASAVVFIEEIIPWTDFIPSFTIMWIWTHFFGKKVK
jgi:hypothetical protein